MRGPIQWHRCRARQAPAAVALFFIAVAAAAMPTAPSKGFIVEPKRAEPLVPTSAKAPGNAEDAFEIKVTDAKKSPLREFRAIAGVKPGVSSNVPDVVNWQPHTLRTGFEGKLVWPLDKAYDEMALRLEADGYRPHTSSWIKKRDGVRTLEFELVSDAGIRGQILTPDGEPASGAVLALAMVQRDAVLEAGKLRGHGQTLPDKVSDRWRRPLSAEADAEGRFQVPRLDDATAAALIVHPTGVREMRFADFEATPLIKLEAWGRIEGRVLWKDKPGVDEHLNLTIHRDLYGYPGVVAQYEKTKSDPNGNFVFENVLPGRAQIARPFVFDKPTKSGTTHVMLPGLTGHVEVKAGAPTTTLIGGRGRRVKGRLTGRDSWDGVTIHFHPRAPHIGFARDEVSRTAWNSFQKSAIGPLFFRSGLKPAADGTFEIPAVLPGDYQLFVDGNSGYRQFAVEPEAVDRIPEVLDLGEIKVGPQKNN